MILCFDDIQKAFSEQGDWQAFRDGERIYSSDLHLNPNSIDVGLGDIALRPTPLSRHLFTDPEIADCLKWETETFEQLFLRPNDFVLAHVRERFDCAAPLLIDGKMRYFIPMIEGRSTLARCGLSAHECAGFGDFAFGSPGPNGEPGGNFTLELSTHLPIVLRPGFRIAQVFFIEGSSGSTRYTGSYASQADFPRAPVLGRNRI